jgi:hypothetical protein
MHRRAGDADRGAELDLSPGDRQRLSQAVLKLLGAPERVAGIAPLKHHGELVAAEATDLGLREHLADQADQMDDRLIAAGVTETVVQLLQVIEIDQEQ